MDRCIAAGRNCILHETEEEEATLLFLSQFKAAPVDQRLIDAAASLYRRWQPSHGIDINDAILAATVMQTGGRSSA